jgi:hypothetical protein
MDDTFLKYPIYIVSKGRFENPLTAKYFVKDGITDFKIVVEPQEYEQYCNAVGKDKVLKLPFQNLGLGSFPARNFAWEHSIENGHKKHFIFDDNIRGFYRLNKGQRLRTNGKEAINTLIKFTEKFTNVKISGFNYESLVTRETNKPFTYNTHVYSALLIENSLPFRWRMKYNEDVDLCLQLLSQGFCTILLNAYLIKKVSTVVKMKGGNQDELYKGNAPEKKFLKARSLELMWPQYAEVKIRFGRYHHYVNWKKHFKQPLIRINNEETT